jgi:uncharacterized DUF497 family protein
MNEIEFTWDAKKAKSNLLKHGVSFEEASTIFYDEEAELIFDPEHSHSEDRFIMLGLSTSLRMLVVCHCYLESQSVIRIISARKATKKEAKQYRG